MKFTTEYWTLDIEYCQAKYSVFSIQYSVGEKRRSSFMAAFTLIEIMVVVAIMGIVMTIAIPTVYQQLHPESMRKAVSDVMEACATARARAILDGAPMDLVIHPADKRFEVSASGGGVQPDRQMFSPDVAGSDWRMPAK